MFEISIFSIFLQSGIVVIYLLHVKTLLRFLDTSKVTSLDLQSCSVLLKIWNVTRYVCFSWSRFSNICILFLHFITFIFLQEEIFGPVLICMQADSLEEAINILNRNK